MSYTHFNRTAAMILAGAMMLSCTSCALLEGFSGPNKQEIIDAADDFADALRSAIERNDAIIDIGTSEIDNQLKKLHAILLALIPVVVFMIIRTIIWIICE